MKRHKPERRNLKSQPGFVADSKSILIEIVAPEKWHAYTQMAFDRQRKSKPTS